MFSPDCAKVRNSIAVKPSLVAKAPHLPLPKDLDVSDLGYRFCWPQRVKSQLLLQATEKRQSTSHTVDFGLIEEWLIQD
jgi:hypothetical protein